MSLSRYLLVKCLLDLSCLFVCQCPLSIFEKLLSNTMLQLLAIAENTRCFISLLELVEKMFFFCYWFIVNKRSASLTKASAGNSIVFLACLPPLIELLGSWLSSSSSGSFWVVFQWLSIKSRCGQEKCWLYIVSTKTSLLTAALTNEQLKLRTINAAHVAFCARPRASLLFKVSWTFQAVPVRPITLVSNSPDFTDL